VLIDDAAILRRARVGYSAFYAAAAAEEAAVLDGYLLARAAFRLGVAAPREGIDGPVRERLERATDGMERRLLELRDRLVKLPAFLRLPEAVRAEVLAV
jgi:hypothetical protein